MLDHFVVLTKGGIVLWSRSSASLVGRPVDSLIEHVLLEERGAEKQYFTETYGMKWTVSNDLDLLFVAVYQRILQLGYVDELLSLIKIAFVDMFRQLLVKNSIGPYSFDEEYDDIFKRVFLKGPQKLEKTRAIKGENASNKLEKEPQKEKSGTASEDDDEDDEDDQDEVVSKNNAAADVSNDVGEGKKSPNELLKAMHALKQRRGGRKRGRRGVPVKASSGKGSPAEAKPSGEGKRKKKESRVWVNPTRHLSSEEIQSFDHSEPVEDGGNVVSRLQALSTKEKDDNLLSKLNNEDSDDDDEIVAVEETENSNGSGFLSSLVARIQGKKVFNEADLEPVMDSFRELLKEKNVASQVADDMCESVIKGLVGRKVGTFQSVASTAKAAVSDAVTRVLTPKRDIDILRGIRMTQAEGRPYVIVFVGVNGVGKSTSLSKVCKWLQLNDVRCMIAACDTFRSGAVEQLRTHSRNLNVPLFERGYGGDAANVAKAGIARAKEDGCQAVLVDTAGRMQDNTPLMRALAKLIALNNPDLVLFVGEALVGNDSEDQLTKFNNALVDEGCSGLDGIFLTKYDTIDDKVGAALSMVYKTGQPIVFVGTGQTYTDVRRLNVKSVVKTLLN